jgi:hypothetical protein
MTLGCFFIPVNRPALILVDVVGVDGNRDSLNDGNNCRCVELLLMILIFQEFCDDEDDYVPIGLLDATVVLDDTAVQLILIWLRSAWEAVMVFT